MNIFPFLVETKSVLLFKFILACEQILHLNIWKQLKKLINIARITKMPFRAKTKSTWNVGPSTSDSITSSSQYQ